MFPKHPQTDVAVPLGESVAGCRVRCFLEILLCIAASFGSSFVHFVAEAGLTGVAECGESVLADVGAGFVDGGGFAGAVLELIADCCLAEPFSSFCCFGLAFFSLLGRLDPE
jgi:hypothetical protein